MAQSTELQLQLARCLAVCAAGEAEEKTKYLEQAIDLLTAATRKNFKNAVVLQTDPSFAVLREHPVYKKIMEQVQSFR